MTTRRDLLKLAGAGAVGLGIGPTGARAPAAGPDDTPVEKAARPLRILILGGTGFTGPHQVRYALARGHQLTLFNRGRRPKEWPAKVEELVGDRNTGDLGALAGREWDVCIDNPTTLPFWVRDAGQVLKGKVGHYVFISTLSVYASDAQPGQDESAALHAYAGADPMQETQEAVRKDMSLYGPLKARSEQEAVTWFPGITTIIRPGLIVGPGDESDRFTYWPARLDRGGDVAAPGDGSDAVQFVDARDLAEWTVRVAEAKASGVFNAMGPRHAMTMGRLLCGIQAATTSDARLHWLPAEFLEQQKVGAWMDMPVWVPSAGDTGGFARRSNARALAAGLTFRPLAQTALDTLAWYRSWPAERRAADLRAGLKPEREAALLAAWTAKKR
ncbi:MAG: NAD-dependent epimerase/dehydratase family protein [Vicinamibacteria bacterium]